MTKSEATTDSVYGAIVKYAYNNGGNHPSLRSLARDMGKKLGFVSFHVKKLIACNRMSRTDDGDLETTGGYAAAYRSMMSKP